MLEGSSEKKKKKKKKKKKEEEEEEKKSKQEPGKAVSWTFVAMQRKEKEEERGGAEGLGKKVFREWSWQLICRPMMDMMYTQIKK